ncbi:MAG TPA: metallophosphoesterase [Ignavibacteriaceae bacterium]|nr:metallophosphoesterase [Ignavibacteriaceae bacterium]
MMTRTIKIIIILFFLFFSSNILFGQNLTFGVIGDFGNGSQEESDVASVVKSWNPDFIITLGDNNYPDGSASTIDRNIGYDYHQFIKPYTGSYGAGSSDINRFWPVPGNHDWRASNLQPYRDYFTLPHNEYYYNITIGDIEFFMIDSDGNEPDKVSYNATQGQWIHQQILASTAKWKIAVFHHPAYSSDSNHGSNSSMQWPFEDWGIDAVMAGHAHTYERILRDDNSDGDSLVYFVNGLGGKSIYGFGTPVNGSKVRYNGDYGAMKVSETQDGLLFQFFTRTGNLIDSYLLNNSTVGVEETSFIPAYKLFQNYPNPFNPSTIIQYEISKSDNVTLKIFDVLGKEVKTLVNKYQPAGNYEVQFDASGLKSGVYFYRLTVGEFSKVNKLILMK